MRSLGWLCPSGFPLSLARPCFDFSLTSPPNLYAHRESNCGSAMLFEPRHTPLRDHDGRHVRVRGWDRRHDRGIDDG